MYRSLWNNFHKSVCSFNFFGKKGIQFHRFTGFRYKGHIVTCLSREETGRCDSIVIDFPPDDPAGEKISLCLSRKEFNSRISGETRYSPAGVMLFPLEPGEFKSVIPVTCSPQPSVATGTPVAVFSYSRQISQLYMKTGLVSSYINIKGEQFIFVESSCEQGNAGSPLVNAETGEVIGVMVDCPPSPGESHNRLKGIINENIRMLDKVAGRWTMGEIDPAQVMTANLHMMKHLAREIYLSSHRNYGFALPSGRLSRYLKYLEHRNQISAGNIASGK